jgi:hypothetical protein
MNLTRIIQEVQPDKIYNLAAMLHVKVSFDTPEYAANADGISLFASSRRFLCSAWRRRRSSTRPPHPSSTVLFQTPCKARVLPSEPDLRIRRPSAIPAGRPSTIVKRTGFTRQTVFYSITRVRFLVKSLSRGRSRGESQK